MPKLKVDLQSSSYRLTNIEEIKKTPLLMMYFKDFLDCRLNSDKSVVTIPFDKNEKEEVLQKILKGLSRYDIPYDKGASLKQQMTKFYKERENFSIFSDRALNIREGDFNKAELEDFASVLSRKMERTLYDLQLLSAYHLSFSQNACNFSVPGAGKTSIVYGAYAYLKNIKNEEKKVEKLLVVGPLSSFGPWEEEYLGCFGKAANSKRLSGGVNEAEREKILFSSNPPEILLISYQGLMNDLESIISFLKRFKVMVVLDEAHYIKNIEGGAFSTSALEVSKYANSRVVLTGTPAPNGYEDLYNLFDFIWPGKNIIGFSKRQLKYMSKNKSKARVESLVEKLKPYFIRIRKSDLDLPPPEENPLVTVEPGDLQKEIYSYLQDTYFSKYQNTKRLNQKQGQALRAKVIRLMQAASNPGMLSGPVDSYMGSDESFLAEDSYIMNKILNYEENEIPAKYTKAAEIITNLLKQEKKVVVWSSFIYNIENFSDHLTEEGVRNRTLYGATPVENEVSEKEIETRESILRMFKDAESGLDVLIANPFATSESISLHKACQHAIYLDRTFNATHLIQSKDRIHRLDMPDGKTAHYYYLATKGTVDEKIHDRLLEKEKLMLEVIEREEIPLLNMALDEEGGTNEDLRAILDDYQKRHI